MSRVLSEHAIEHVVLERGEVANSWRHERWDSLRLLTPNWQSGLPGFPYQGSDPDGYMTMPQVAEHLAAFAQASSAPVRTRSAVTRIARAADGYHVHTEAGVIACRCLVLASGAANAAQDSPLRAAVPPRIESVTAFAYRNPHALPPGAVLVVGASASGVQLADEIQRSGRQVMLCVGEHVRLPRTYRGRDVLWWMEKSGVWNQRYDEIDDLERARRLPSPQLVGTPERVTLDLNALGAAGVEIVGRLGALRNSQALFSGGLRNQLALADLKMERLLDTFDAWAGEHPEQEFEPAERFPPTRIPAAPKLSVDLNGAGFGAIVWATGFRPDYRWLDLPVFNFRGEIEHEGGVVRGAPGVYAIGLPVLRRRKSTFIIGAQDDARELAAHLVRFLSDGVWPAAQARRG
jgi:putative flavoprotein involved in K+ transport